ncbi:multicopper oxidase family protein [Corynebacterium guangdongense]|uniref:FtsP/CotA-like multicopper oxidase with cupredoxin domain n=1 Tax=Corynebacterium guangdongense TaxID=1783348 RepID=A0ABU1ZUZ9_9CORY|nr:multicopper oxidase family protein [Corynebacterium guangdongense]MDR7328761.1 FtsP/CotA-like multicopper oxidase with cupredoxin domain [Corynebacterium guangdongense]WJZ17337.1 Multicopper oxidase mco [Corynebacterium guangdongense]
MSNTHLLAEGVPTRRSWTVIARRVVAVLAVALVAWVAWLWWDSRFPAIYSTVPESAAVLGHGGHSRSSDELTGDHPTRSIADLGVDPALPPDVRVTLEARSADLSNATGGVFSGYTLNGSTPGPEIRARQGDLVEVELINVNIADGTTLHWHGVDVPGAMDGVAGVTQDAVMPGESFTYRFLAEDSGTYWYHAHQVSHQQVMGGLLGPLVVEPTGEDTADIVMLLHTYPGGSRTLAGVPGQTRQEFAPGSIVRVRVINTDNGTSFVWVPGAPVRVLAIDGTDLHGPGPVQQTKIRLAAGGRADLEVTVPPDGGVRVQTAGASLILGPGEAGAPETPAPAAELDLLAYGTPAATPLAHAEVDKSYEYIVGQRPGFLDGRPGYWWTINGKMGKHVPSFSVREGDVVAMTVTNKSSEVHPMHLHGHHLLVLARDGVTSSSAPWWTDSLDVAPGESYDVVFLADNPGVWMDHCHNLPHAVEGLMTHVVYEGVTTPYLLGRDSGNEPE